MNTCRKCHRAAKYRGLCMPHFNADGRAHGYIDAEPVRQRVELLRARGYTLAALEQRTGLDRQTLLCHKVRRVQATTANAVMTVPIPHVAPASAKLVPAVGARRRAQALVVLGWSQSAIARRAGLRVGVVNKLVMGHSVRVTAATAAAVRGVFADWAMTPGPSARARQRAADRGWVPPLAWDDNIDDPDATPDMGEQRPVSFADRYTELVEHVGVRSEERIAQMLGIAPESVRDQVYRNKLARVS